MQSVQPRTPLGSSPASGQPRRPFGFVRLHAWVVLLLIILLAVLFSAYIGNRVRDNLIRKQKEFAVLLADNLNTQLYRRFTLPMMVVFGEVMLSNASQFERLHQLIHLTIHGLNVNDLRIFSNDQVVSYSADKEELGSKDFAGPDIAAAGMGSEPVFRVEAKLPYWKAFFQFPLAPNSYVLKISYPLADDNRLYSSQAYGPALGVLQFSQDITPDVESALRFQQLIIAIMVTSSSLLFILLIFFIRRAEQTVAARMQQEQRLLLELHQSEKLAGMGRVIASIAHEIRNPLGIIRSSAELLLKRDADKSSASHRILQAVFDESRRLSQTVSDFLDYAKPRSPQSQPVDVAAVINKALIFLEPEFQQRHVLVRKQYAQQQAFFVPGDTDLLYRAFYNIMSNALQAMQEFGVLSISIEEKVDDGPVLFIVFRDSGPGFPEDHLDHLLDPFFTTKDDGTGLGLPIVNNIIISHNGVMTLSNPPDGGAEVKIVLPQMIAGSLVGAS